MDGIWKMPMQAQLAAVRSGALRAEALVQEYLKRLTRCGGPDGLNVLAELNPHVLEEARALDAQTARSGLLFGLPILVKDNIDVKGLHTTAGSFALRDNLAEHDAPVVRNLRRAGALILGKTNLTEFAHYTSSEMPNGFSSHGGQVYSAYGRDKDPGGSSTGSAVAVSAGLCAAAIGTDTSFSVIGCAADNGVTGLKPAHGSLSGCGIVPIASLLDSAGPLTRTFADAVQVYSAMRGEPLAPLRALEAGRLRLAVNIFQEETVPEAQKALYRGVLDALRGAGAEITMVEHPYQPMQSDVMRCAFRHDLEDYLAGTEAENRTLEQIVAQYEANAAQMPYGIDLLRAALGSGVTDPDYVRALEKRQTVRAALMESLRDVDACLMTGPTNAMHFCGLPSVALRLGMDASGAPCGMILYGADEKRLFSAALCIEQYAGPISWPQGIE